MIYIIYIYIHHYIPGSSISTFFLLIAVFLGFTLLLTFYVHLNNKCTFVSWRTGIYAFFPDSYLFFSMRCKQCHNSGAMMLISMVISPQNIAKNMVLTYLHFRILDPLENLPLIMNMSLYQFIMGRIYGPYHHPINFGWYSYKYHISYKCHFMIYHFLKLPLIMNISLYKCHQFMPSIHVIHGDLSLP